MMVNFAMLALIVLPLMAAPLIYFLGRKHPELLGPLSVTVCTVELILSAVLAEQQRYIFIDGLLGIGVSFSLNAFSAAWCVLSSLVWLAISFFSGTTQTQDAHLPRFHLFSMITFGAVQGVFLSADLYTAFVCFELMIFGCYALIKHNQLPPAFRAGQTYLVVSLTAATATLFGLLLLHHQVGSLDYGAVLVFSRQNPALYAAGIPALCGFLAQTGLFPMHVWLPGAYTQSPAPAGAVLVGIITKCGAALALVIMGRLSLGNPFLGYALLMLSLATMIWGGALALSSVDLKRALGYSSMSQMGLIMLGISMFTLLGENGLIAAAALIAQMMNHAVQYLALFIISSAILLHARSTNLNKLQGYGRNKPVLMLCFLFAALSVSGVPGLSGYVSLTLLRESIIEFSARQLAVGKVIELLFLLSNGLTLGYLVKLFVCVFVERGDDEPMKGRCLDLRTAFILGGCTLVMLVMGIAPWNAFELLALRGGQVFIPSALKPIPYFSLSNLLSVPVSVIVAAGLYFFVVPRYLTRSEENKNRRYIDPLSGGPDLMEDVYRPAFSRWVPLGLKRTVQAPTHATIALILRVQRYRRSRRSLTDK